MVGDGNRLAYAAAKSVSAAPGATAGALVLHGPQGVGKTHLLGAIGRRLLLERPELGVAYVAVAIPVGEGGRLEGGALLSPLGSQGERPGVLLVDDLELLAQGSAAAELRDLFADGGEPRLVVASADRPPALIPELDERLAARLHGALVVDLREPDERTREAILRSRLRGVEGRAPGPSALDRAAPAAARSPLPERSRQANVDSFFTDPYKVFLHWEPVADRLVERLG